MSLRKVTFLWKVFNKVNPTLLCIKHKPVYSLHLYTSELHITIHGLTLETDFYLFWWKIRWWQKTSIRRRWGRKAKMERVYRAFILKTLMTGGGINSTLNCRRRRQLDQKAGEDIWILWLYIYKWIYIFYWSYMLLLLQSTIKHLLIQAISTYLFTASHCLLKLRITITCYSTSGKLQEHLCSLITLFWAPGLASHIIIFEEGPLTRNGLMDRVPPWKPLRSLWSSGGTWIAGLSDQDRRCRKTRVTGVTRFLL